MYPEEIVVLFVSFLELKLSDEFLRSNMDTGFSTRFNSTKISSKLFSSKITISSSYLKGYLEVAK